MEGCRIEVKSETYVGSSTQDAVKNSDQFIRFIEIHGKVSEQDDLPIFEEISKYCHESTTKLTIKFMQLETLDIDRLDIFPNLKELELDVCKLSVSFMHFDQWCPNLISLKIGRLYFDVPELYEDWVALTENHKSPLLRSLNFEMEDKEEVYSYLELFEKQFPLLENLYLEFGTETNFTSGRSPFYLLSSPDNDGDSTEYESVYFNKLKKLTVFAYGQCDDIFNYLKISNKMLKDIEFCGMNADKGLIKSICNNYPKLTKLKLSCSYVYEDELHRLTNLPKLMTLSLDTKYFHWKPSEMMTFIQNAKRLRRLIVDVDRKSGKYPIDDKFKEQFQELVKGGRRFLQLNIKFFQTSQEIKLSRNGMVDIPPDVSSESESGFGF